MTSSECHAKLNDLLVRLNRSLLQYVGESWPWTEEESQETLSELEGLVKRQQNDVARLVELLMSHRWPIDFSNYPTDFTDKHFLSLDFLVPQIIGDETSVMSFCEAALAGCGGDEATAELLKQIRANEVDGIERLERLLKTRKAAATIAASA